MANRFTRVTVVADGRGVDLSLPATRPVLEYLPQVCDLLSMPPQTTGRWTLSTVSAGTLDPRRTLDECGIADADTVFLSPPEAAPLPPVVDDVVDEVESRLDGDGSEWTGRSREAGCAGLAGVVVLVLTGVFGVLPPTATVALGLAVVATVAVLLGRWLVGTGGAWLIGAAVPAWLVVAGTAVAAAGWGRPAALAAALAGAGAGATAFALAGPRWSPLVAAGVPVATLGALATGLFAGGLAPERVAAVGAVVLVFAVGLAQQAALGSSGLVRLIREQEDGRWVARDDVGAAVRRGQGVLTGALLGVAVLACCTCAVLAASGQGPAGALALVLGVVFALRARLFTRTWQVVPMLLPPVTVAAVGVTLGPWQLASTGDGAALMAAVGALLLVGVLVGAGRARMDEVAAARLRQLLDMLEMLAVVALVPLVIAVFGGFDWALR
ncbi:type VII secretion integral membrane protein EccD [Plantactinospora sp. GCM10030261]|uniref:type VII secretion integral membrane protein EccD n=1 Tax=Plantactinospora sp. GCM10030261 TaxID=3273420 RepID=UPI00360CC1E1